MVIDVFSYMLHVLGYSEINVLFALKVALKLMYTCKQYYFYCYLLQPASKQQVKALLDKHRPAVMTKAQPTSSNDQKQPKKDAANSPPAKASTKKTTAATKGSKPKTKGGDGKKKGEEDIEGAPLILVQNGKETRMKDEEKLKVLLLFVTTATNTCIVHVHVHVHVLLRCTIKMYVHLNSTS